MAPSRRRKRESGKQPHGLLPFKVAAVGYSSAIPRQIIHASAIFSTTLVENMENHRWA
jgi:hypothetical protein